MKIQNAKDLGLYIINNVKDFKSGLLSKDELNDNINFILKRVSYSLDSKCDTTVKGINVKYVLEDINKNYSEKTKNTMLTESLFFSMSDGKAFNIFYNNTTIESYIRYIITDIASKLDLQINQHVLKDNDKLTMLNLLVWKDNNIDDFILRGTGLQNPNVTIKEVFDSFDGMHMTLERLEAVINNLISDYNYLNQGTLDVNYKNKIYYIWEEMLKEEDVNIGFLRNICSILEKINK